MNVLRKVVSQPKHARMRREAPVHTPFPGSVIGGKYRILQPLGEGGMGAVYEAEHTLTLKRCAIKWLHPRVAKLQEASKRLVHEARAAARVRHNNVVDVYDVLLEGDSIFLVMELLIGEPLSVWLARVNPPMDALIGLLLPAMRGVAAAHAVGVVHRDIKPDNIFLMRESEGEQVVPKVIDFGISRVVEADGSRITRSGITLGTPRYVSYEQLRGVRDIDERTDVYAFGVILYECLVGRPPYVATTFGEQAISFITTDPPTPCELRPEVPPELGAAVARSLAKERERRTPSMAVLIEALEPFSHAEAYASVPRAFAPAIDAQPSDIALPDEATDPGYSPPPSGEQPRQLSPSVPSPAPWRRARGPALLLLGVGAALVLLATPRSPRPARVTATPETAARFSQPRPAPEAAPVNQAVQSSEADPSAASVAAEVGGAAAPARRATGRRKVGHVVADDANDSKAGKAARPADPPSTDSARTESVLPDVPHRADRLQRDEF